MNLLRLLKRSLPLPLGREPRRICFGIAKGVKMVMSFDNKLQRFLGVEEREIFEDFSRLAMQSRALLDIGASDGVYPLAAINLNPQIICLGVDASDEMEMQAEENKQLNAESLPVEHIQWKKCFAGKEHITLDALASTLPRPLLIKMDIDGGEVDALSSGLNTLGEQAVSLIVEIHSDELQQGCIRLLSDLGYTCKVLRNAWWRIILPEQRVAKPNHWLVAERL